MTLLVPPAATASAELMLLCACTTCTLEPVHELPFSSWVMRKNLTPLGEETKKVIAEHIYRAPQPTTFAVYPQRPAAFRGACWSTCCSCCPLRAPLYCPSNEGLQRSSFIPIHKVMVIAKLRLRIRLMRFKYLQLDLYMKTTVIPTRIARLSDERLKLKSTVHYRAILGHKIAQYECFLDPTLQVPNEKLFRLSHMSAKELKDLCLKFLLPVTGPKPKLISRLYEVAALQFAEEDAGAAPDVSFLIDDLGDDQHDDDGDAFFLVSAE